VLRIATWNVNSVRTRLDRVLDWLDRSDVDVLAIQETKCRDDQFPYEQFDAAGYEVAHVGLNQWNGVAIASRVGLADIQVGFEDQPGFDRYEADTLDIFGEVTEARAIGATCGEVRVWSLYVPNGRSTKDPHFEYKLGWLANLRADASRWLAANPDAQVVLAGDWNIAPTDDDVWSVAYFADKDAHDACRTRGLSGVRRFGLHRRGPTVHSWTRRLHLLGLHPTTVRQTRRNAHRLRPRLPCPRRPSGRRVDRPGRAKRQGRQRSRPCGGRVRITPVREPYPGRGKTHAQFN
jgi:exodeoxyribonuclease III